MISETLARLARNCGINPTGKTAKEIREEHEEDQRHSGYRDQHDMRLTEELDREDAS